MNNFQTNIKIESDQLNKFNAGEIIQFTPYFIYDDETSQDVSSIKMTMPRFPSILKNVTAESSLNSVRFDEINPMVPNEYRIVRYRNLSTANSLEVTLEGDWYYPYYSDGKTSVILDKTGIVDKTASITPLSTLTFVASAGNSASPFNNKNLQVNLIWNAPQATLATPSTAEVKPTTGSIVLRFDTDISKTPINIPITTVPKSNSWVSVNKNTAALRERRIAKKYKIWKLSVSDQNYLSTLNNNKYIKDIVIFSYSSNDGQTKYLIQSRNENTPTRIDVTSLLPSYSNISSLYILEGIARLSIPNIRIYDNALNGPNVQFYARVIRFIDPSGQENFTTATSISDHDWVQMVIKNG